MSDTSFLTMNFLLRTLRDWLVRLEAIALQNPALFQEQIDHKPISIITAFLMEMNCDTLILNEYANAKEHTCFFFPLLPKVTCRMHLCNVGILWQRGFLFYSVAENRFLSPSHTGDGFLWS